MIENRLRIHLGSSAALYVMGALLSTGTCAQTSIKTDASWGRTPATLIPSASNTTVIGNQGASRAIPGNLYTITEGQGRVAGANLFHSFESFSVGTGDGALFTTSTPSLNNVISRVSGPSPTSLNGLLALKPENGGNPNFFFINPNGVTFGAGAQVDVPAAFHVSTANSLNFADGTVFKAGNGSDSTLTIAAPEAFGFLGNRPVTAVNFNNLDSGGNAQSRLNIGLAPGSTFGITGGAVQFASVNVSVPEGVLRVRATGNAAVEVPVNAEAGIPLAGSMEASDAALSTTGAGTIHLAGGAVILRNRTAISGNVGSVNLTAGSSLLVSGNNTSISTATDGAIQGGNIQIAAREMKVEQLGKITAETSGKGKAGNITMTGESLAVLTGGRIEAGTSGEGKGGSIVVTTTGDVTVSGVSADGQTRSGLFAKTQSPSAGTGGGGGGAGAGGGGGGGGTAKPGNAGDIAIISKNLLLESGAQIDSSTTSGGAGGSVAIATAENITIAGSNTRLTSDATRGGGQGGSITLVAKNITVRDAARVTAATGGKGDAGNVSLTALDQLLLQSAGTVTTSTSGSGKGGTIAIQASQVMLDGPGTAITADTLRPFADLTITIDILHPNDGDLVVQLDSPAGSRVALLSRVGGSGDNFTGTKLNDQATNPITSGSAPFTGTFKPREPLAQLINELVAGNWTLNVRDQATGNTGSLQNWTLQIGQQTFQSAGASRTIPDNGNLRSVITVANPILETVQGTGEASGIGGDVTVNAGSVTVQDGATMSAISRGSGKGGTVNLEVSGGVSVLDNARIATDTLGSGPAGNVLINAQNLLVSLSEVSSSSSASLSGNAGDIGINLGGTLTLLNEGLISSSTKSIQGAAGSIEANAKQILVDGQDSAILAGALEDSSGQTGSLTVKATSAITVSNGGILSIVNDATLTNRSLLIPTVLSVSAPNITLKDAKITAESTGDVDASDIQIQFTGRLWVDPSSITTSAMRGNGGDISIGGGQVVQLDNSQITTSVEGTIGNGGNINIQATALVMNTGFIQANTAAPGASGGNVTINVQTLLPSGNTLLVGGSEPFVFQPGVFGLNVIQAAAPTGVSGTINSTNPTLDTAGNLKGLTAEVIELGRLGKDLCRVGAGSSFTPLGRGGLRPTAAGLMRPENVSLPSKEELASARDRARQAGQQLAQLKVLSDCR